MDEYLDLILIRDLSPVLGFFCYDGQEMYRFALRVVRDFAIQMFHSTGRGRKVSFDVLDMKSFALPNFFLNLVKLSGE
jgi:hypothetical protein